MEYARYFYACAYLTRADALEAIYDMYASGEISPADRPRIESYIAKNGKRRYGVTLEG